MANKLFTEFEKVSKKQWIEKATTDLKGADFDKKLTWRTYEDFNLNPFYTPEDMDNVNYLTDLPKTFGKEKGIDNSRFWINYREIIVEDESKSNEEVKIALDGGADGIIFNLKGNDIDFSKLLKGVGAEYCTISFVKVGDTKNFIKKYFNFLKSTNVNLSNIRGFIQRDEISNYSTCGCRPDFKNLANTIKISNEAPKFYTNVITSHHLIDAGSNYTQEIAFTLNKLIDYIDLLEKEGVSTQEVLDNTMFNLAMGGDYFFDLAKFRVLKVLLLNILNEYKNLNIDLDKLHFMGSSSLWTKTVYDPNVNMLRNTTEAMSAVIGGANSIFISAYDSNYQKPNNFSNRISLNISNLLKDEAYLDTVVDPSSGSYFIENLTNELINYSLELFKNIESKGGFVKCIEDNTIQNLIKDVRNKKEKDISFRKSVFVGSNKYPNLSEEIKSDLIDSPSKYSCKNEEVSFNLLKRQRAVKVFEDLRNITQINFENTEKKPLVYLSLFGNLAMRKARSTFSSDFFGTAGFEISENIFDSVDKAIEESAKSNSDIIVMCASDDDYTENAVSFAKEFKNKTDKILVLAGEPKNIDELKSAGVDEFINVKSNVIEILGRFQNKLNLKK